MGRSGYFCAMVLLAYAAAVLIGITLGLIGGGGSILTLPVLVYLLHIPSSQATSYSLFIVGLSALSGAFGYMRRQLVCYRTVLVFGIPSIVAIYFSRKRLFPSLPEEFHLFGGTWSKDMVVLLLFALLMLAAAFSMIRPVMADQQEVVDRRYRYLLVLLEGLFVGGLVGLVGAGGGFLIIPALVLLANLPMKKAIGTSLVLIFINSAIGFAGDMGNHIALDWDLLLLFSALSVGGIIVGLYISKFISGARLRPVFGWIVLAMGLFIITQQLVQRHREQVKTETNVYQQNSGYLHTENPVSPAGGKHALHVH